MKAQLLKVADVPASLYPFKNFEQPFTSSSSTSTSRFIDTFSEVTDSSHCDTAWQQSNFFEISISLEVSGCWYFGKDLTALWSVISITNLPGIPFCSPRVAVVARRLWFVNRPSIPASLHKLFKTFPPAYCGLLDNFHTKLQKIYIYKILWDYIYNLTHMICYFL